MSTTEKPPELLQLKPEELIQYQQFFQSEAQVFAQFGQITMNYEAAKEQASGVLKQISQSKENWIVRALSSRGINPSLGNWQIDPSTGNILNTSKLTVAK